MTIPKTIFITGASSGIGAALAEYYAMPGNVLFLCGRNRTRLQAIAGQCIKRGAQVHSLQLDVIDQTACSEAIIKANQTSKLDLVIANAGISGGTGQQDESDHQTREIMDINLNGVFNTVFPAIEVMKSNGQGQIAIMSSLASFKGLPSAPAYCASKAAVRTWGESLRGTLKKSNIKVSVITPGFVKSGITAVNKFPMPFLMESSKAATIIGKGLERNKARISFPKPMYLAVLFFSTLPLFISEFISNKLPNKQ
ncbi:short-chain dehydrogenase [Kiloniella litopenaei]|uniref:Short-chain dehydrogenase n=1 Tax=Kiloniella litopenaei TaxID=1549748 RepID=A0A0M2R842_9PROT|nr:SDR family NAD(P)-dependent oxidoreductase [Kiloniella litopenaei]KKJ76599.1 short-chain dehydrogenase [Kiloniella litopenaei]